MKVDLQHEAIHGPCRSHECKRVRAEMQAEIYRLRNALSELRPYATHSDDCGDMSAYNNDPVPRCGCGLDSTLDAIDSAMGTVDE